MLTFLLALACSPPPEPQVVSSKDIRAGSERMVCAGLKQEDAALRQLAAETIKNSHIVTDCACERAIYDGKWDPIILNGFAGARDESLACLGNLLADKAQPERAKLAEALIRIPAARPSLVAAARTETDPTVRSAAMLVLRGTKDATELAWLVDTMRGASDDTVRAAAARALYAQPAASNSLREVAVAADVPAVVRGAAVSSYLAGEQADRDVVACAALSDAAPEVRFQAARSSKASKSVERVACLTAALNADEPDDDVRAAVLAAVLSSPSPAAAKALCDALPGWTRAVVKERRPPEAIDIARAQNIRAPDDSYACFQKAAAAGGYTCAGRAYLLGWFKDVGGKVGVPNCHAGGAPVAGGGTPSNEVSFE